MGRTKQSSRDTTAPAGLPLGRILGHVERLTTRRIEAEIARHALTVDQWRVLDILADGEGHPMSELAGTIVVPGPTLTKLVDKLVDNALVYRLVDDNDRRRVLAFLSAKGLSVHAELAPVVATVERDLVAGLGPDGSMLVDLLAQLAEQYAADGAAS